MAIHSSILAWRTSWTEESGGLRSTGSQRVGHDWSNLACVPASNLKFKCKGERGREKEGRTVPSSTQKEIQKCVQLSFCGNLSISCYWFHFLVLYILFQWVNRREGRQRYGLDPTWKSYTDCKSRNPIIYFIICIYCEKICWMQKKKKCGTSKSS